MAIFFTEYKFISYQICLDDHESLGSPSREPYRNLLKAGAEEGYEGIMMAMHLYIAVSEE